MNTQINAFRNAATKNKATRRPNFFLKQREGEGETERGY